ncbi:MAG: hypothetical protein Kow0090_11680 [Myxococcota bacterium]
MKARICIFILLVVLSAVSFGCGDFSDACNDLVDRVCDRCSEEWCEEWRGITEDELATQEYCLRKLETFADEIEPKCNEE